MLGPPGPWVSSRKHPSSQMTLRPSGLDLGEQISRITNWKTASSKHLPRTDLGKDRRHVALGPMRQHPAGTSRQGQSNGSSSSSPAEVLS